MTDIDSPTRRVIGVEEHAWTPDLRDALLRFGGDDIVNLMSSQGEVNLALLDVGEERLARMDDAGVAVEILSITTPGTQPLASELAVPLARDANDCLASAVARHPDRFAAFATLPTSDPAAAAGELERALAGADSRGPFGGTGGAQAFVDTAPIDSDTKDKLAHANAEALFGLAAA